MLAFLRFSKILSESGNNLELNMITEELEIKNEELSAQCRIWKFIQIDIWDTDSYPDSDSLFQLFYHSNPLLNNNYLKIR